MKLPVFTISLDFELHWGRFDKADLQDNRQYYQRTRSAIPEILQLFEEFQIEATWATVGMLFASDLQEWEKYSPIEKPSYSQQRFSAYEWIKGNPVQKTSLFAPDLIERILKTEGQELGSHTFSHYCTMANGQTERQFRQDLKAVQQIATEKFGVRLSSLVFPRNQFNQVYLKICLEEGFTAIRSNPSDWYWKDTSRELLLKKIFRTGDSLVPLGRKPSYLLSTLKVDHSLPLMLPASRFLRPHRKDFPPLNRLKLKRVKDELTKAAQEGEVYHLWWHPHNHGRNPMESMKDLTEILVHFDTLRSQYGMISRNMKNVTALVKSANEIVGWKH